MVFLPWAPIQNLDRSSALTDIAEHHDATLHQIALAWLLARSDTMLTISGTGSVDHLEENVAAAGLRLEPDEIAALNELG
jgi:aryl-alcohol dehydrogenase-like predicted oxidoreductase